MHLDDSSKAIDMSPAAVSRRIRKAFDLGMLNRHYLSKLVKVSPERVGIKRQNPLAGAWKTEKDKTEHGRG